MPHTPGPSRRLVFSIIFASCFLAFIFVGSFRNVKQGVRHPDYERQQSTTVTLASHSGLLTGPVIAPKLGNETIKAELGRAAWKLFHTTFAKFPDEPNSDESLALLTYIHLFQRLYPCGECATHFRQILDRYPPQVSSRSAAAAWGCFVHNEVNLSLGKAQFDCSKLGDFYDCGCAEDEIQAGKREQTDPRLEEAHGARQPANDEMLPVELQHEQWQKGG